MSNIDSILLECADILKDTSVLFVEEKAYVVPERRLEFECQVASRVNEVTECLKNLMDKLGRDVSAYSTRNWSESRKRWQPLRTQSERATRRVELLKASDPREMRAALGWMLEQGRSEELEVLRGTRKRPIFADENIAALFDLTERKVKQRVYGTHELGTQDDDDASREETFSGMGLLLRSYRNQPTGEREQTLAQIVIGLNSLALRNKGTSAPRGSLSRSATSQFLTSIADDVMHLLVKALHDPRSVVRREAAGALGEWGDKSVVMPLAQLLLKPMSDEDESVRRSCVGALGQIGGPTAVGALIAAAEQDPTEAVRRDAIYALIELVVSDDAEADDLIKQEIMQAMARVSHNPREGEFLRSKAQSFVELLT